MTRAEARTQLQALGLTLNRTQYGEWRVNFRHQGEATAYYTDDLNDAVGTGRKMAEQVRDRA